MAWRKGAYIAKGAVVVDAVTLGAHSMVWHDAVLRGDIQRTVAGFAWFVELPPIRIMNSPGSQSYSSLPL